MNYPLAVHGPVDLIQLYIFNTLTQATVVAKEELQQLNATTNSVLEIYAAKHSDMTDEIGRLRREIRLATTGVPVTAPMDATSAMPMLRTDPNFNEQQFNAHRELCKRAYKRLAMMTHPDRGGTKELFDEVQYAYKNNDLKHLNDIYIRVHTSRNLYWQQSQEGIDYASTEYERPKVQTMAIKANPVFAIARHHMAGRKLQADAAMQLHLVNTIQALSNELHFLRTKR